MVACKRVYTVLDFLQSWDTWITEAVLESSTSLQFPRSDGTKRNAAMWSRLLDEV